MFNLALGRMGRVGNITGIQRAIAFLRALGTSAHVWLPGANGVSVASLPSNNYLLSDGSTGYITVDSVDGLTLDGMGSLGSELVTNGDFSSGTGWTGLNGTVAIAGGVLSGTTSGASNVFARTNINVTAGRTYLLSIEVVAAAQNVSVYWNNPGLTAQLAFASTLGLRSMYIVAAATGVCDVAIIGPGASATATFDNISVKEYTGIHLTQATTANKPLERRGMFNELLNSATPATQSVTCIAAPYTLALYGTGNVVLSGTGAGTLTGTGASDLVVLNFTPTAGSVTFTKAGTVSSFGLFKGTWTAAQILAEGGIPTTTATAASNPSAGKYWRSFDGSNDSLLSGNLGITNACTIVIAGRVNVASGIQMLIGEALNGIQVYIDAAGSAVFRVIGGSALVTTPAGAIVAGVPFVITARLSSGTAVIRKNGVQSATAASAITFAATTGARIGLDFDNVSYPLNGAIGWVVPLPTALSDADCLTVERLVGSQFPGMATF